MKPPVDWIQGVNVDLLDLGVHDLFSQQAKRSPQAIALVSQGQSITYAELECRADTLSSRLHELGIIPEERVAVCLERFPELPVALLGVLKAGGAYLPLDPAWPRERCQQLLREAGCDLLLDGAGVQRLGGRTDPRPSISPSSEGGAITQAGQRLAYVSFTSGSTGRPKGVAIHHQAIQRLVHPVNGFLLGAGARVLQMAPVAFDASTLEIWGPLLNGGTLVMAPPESLTPAQLAALLRHHAITTLWLTAGCFQLMVESELDALAGVRQVLTGGDVLSPSHVLQLLQTFPPGHQLINGYGPTENTTFTACHVMEASAACALTGGAIPIGRPIAQTRVHVLDPAGQPCPVGVPGELHIGGAGLARGYLHQPERTAQAFLPDPFSADSMARLYRSGDLVSWNADGTLAFHGRMDEQIKLRGFRIEPVEIETQLLGHPSVSQAVVVLRRDVPANPQLVAYWVARRSAIPCSAELRSFLAERLPAHMIPAVFLPMEALPLTPNGKLDRRALPAPSLAVDRDHRREPSTHRERQLHELWAEVLGHEDFGVTDNFFHLGGHSLAAALLIARIEQVLGFQLPLATIFHAPQIHLMAELLERTDPGTAVGNPCLVPLQPRGEATPLFVIHGYGGDVFCYTDFARVLTPLRPVYGLQAQGADGRGERHRSVEEMAEHYASLIERQWPTGRVHLLGQSAGGWYVWAVAEVLLRRGRDIGMVAILDSEPSAAISPRLRASLLLRRTVRRIPEYIFLLSHSKRPRTLLAFLRERQRQLAFHLRWFQPLTFQGLDYFDQLHRLYRPSSLPLRVQLFLSRHDPRVKQRLWRALACGGVEARQLFGEHHHFHDPSLAGELAEAVSGTLQRIEGTEWEGGPSRQAT